MATTVNNHGAFVWSIADNLRSYIAAFCPSARDIIDKFEFDIQITLLAEYREALITAAVTGEIDIDEFETERQMEGASS